MENDSTAEHIRTTKTTKLKCFTVDYNKSRSINFIFIIPYVYKSLLELNIFPLLAFLKLGLSLS